MSDVTPESDNAFSALAKMRGEAQPTTHRRWPILTLVAIALTASVGAGWWWERGHQPITPDQRAALTALVDQAATRAGATRQATWDRLVKQPAGVRRIDQLTRRQAAQALERLK